MFTMVDSETVLMITLISRSRTTGSKLQTNVGAIVGAALGGLTGGLVGLGPAVGFFVRAGAAVGIFM